MDEESTASSATPPASDDSHSIGVGLAVVARYVRNMNGQIRVRSELGKGTIFGIELPFEHAAGTPGTLHDEKSIKELPPPRPLSASGPVADGDDSDNSTLRPPSLDKFKAKEIVEDPTTNIDNTTSSSASQNPTITSPFSDTEDITSSVSSPGPGSAEPQQSMFPFPDMKFSNRSTALRPELLKVLIAEDNPINAKFLTKRLTKVGHTVDVAYDGQECHDYFASKPSEVDVILMDLQVSSSPFDKYENIMILEN